jgi:hypothetical protein
MAEPRPVAPATPSTEESDWTDQVTDLIVDVVDRVHDATTGKLITAARWAVFGAAAIFIAVAILVVGIILIGRLLQEIPGPIWIPDVAIGGVLFLVGLALWSKREASA